MRLSLHTIPVSKIQRVRLIASLLLISLVLLGMYLRLRQFSFNRSLWLDEASLANNVVQRPLGALLSEPLASNQGAPIGFLLLSDVLTTLLGPTDLVLRLTPILSSVLTLLVALRLSLLLLDSTVARATFLGLMCCAPVLIYYSSEFKQYTSDVLVTLLILWAGMRYGAHRYSPVILAIAGAVGLWFSHAALFSMAAVGVVLTVEVMARRQWREILPLAAVATVWAASFAADFLLSLQFLATNRSLIAYWRLGYAPVLIESLAELRWYWDSALGFVFLAFGERGLVDPLPRPEWYSPPNLALLSIVVAGVVRLFRRCRRMAGFAMLSVAFTLMASGLKVYPFRARLILFLVPMIFLAAASLVDWLDSRPQPAVRAVSIILAFTLVASLLAPSLAIAATPHNHSDMKGALTYVQSHRVPNDTLAVSAWSKPAYTFYAPQFVLDDIPLLASIPRENDPDAFLRTVCGGGALSPTWIIFSHRLDEGLGFLAKLRQVAPPITSWEGDGSGAYLLDFSRPGVCQGVSGTMLDAGPGD